MCSGGCRALPEGRRRRREQAPHHERDEKKQNLNCTSGRFAQHRGKMAAATRAEPTRGGSASSYSSSLPPQVVETVFADNLRITTEPYRGETHLATIIDLVAQDLSEPYSIFTYRYFLNQWPQLCFVTFAHDPAANEPTVVGVIICKQDLHRSGTLRGYIAMLAVHASMRKRGIGSQLVQLSVRAMRDGGCDEAVLETEVTNTGALRLYEGLGFVRDKWLHRYYLNGNDAYRLKVWFRSQAERDAAVAARQGAPPAATEVA